MSPYEFGKQAALSNVAPKQAAEYPLPLSGGREPFKQAPNRSTTKPGVLTSSQKPQTKPYKGEDQSVDLNPGN